MNRLILIPFLIASLAPGPVMSGDDPSLRKATGLLRDGRIDESIQAFRDLTNQYPSWADGWLGLGFALERKGAHEEAIGSYERALRLDARDVRALNNLGSILVEKGQDLSRGIKLLTRAVTLRPEFAPAWDNLGWAEYRRRNYGKAAEYFKEAIRKDATSISAHFHLGLYYLRREDFRLATIEFRNVVQTQPDHIRGWISLGLANQKMNKSQEAFEAYSKALELVPADSGLRREVERMVHQLGPIYASGLMDGRGPSLLDPAPRPRPNVAASKRTGASSIPNTIVSDLVPSASQASAVKSPRSQPALRSPAAARRNERALSILERPSTDTATAGAPPVSHEVSESAIRQEIIDRHLRFASLYERERLFEDAASEAQTVINIAPWSAAATKAKEILAQASTARASSLEERTSGLMRLGEKMARERDVSGAISQYEKVLLLDGKNAIAYKNLAFLNVSIGKNEVGMGQVRRALEFEPEFPEALVIKGYVEAKERRFKDAYDTYHRLTEVSKEGSQVNAYAREMIGRIRRFVELQ